MLLLGAIGYGPHSLAEFQKIYTLKLLGTPSTNSVWKYGNTLQYPSDSFKATEPVEYIPQLYSLTVNRIGEGTTNDVNASYPEDSAVELLATPNPHGVRWVDRIWHQ